MKTLAFILILIIGFFIRKHIIEYLDNPKKYDFMEYRPKKERNGEEDDL